MWSSPGSRGGNPRTREPRPGRSPPGSRGHAGSRSRARGIPRPTARSGEHSRAGVVLQEPRGEHGGQPPPEQAVPGGPEDPPPADHRLLQTDALLSAPAHGIRRPPHPRSPPWWDIRPRPDTSPRCGPCAQPGRCPPAGPAAGSTSQAVPVFSALPPRQRQRFRLPHGGDRPSAPGGVRATTPAVSRTRPAPGRRRLPRPGSPPVLRAQVVPVGAGRGPPGAAARRSRPGTRPARPRARRGRTRPPGGPRGTSAPVTGAGSSSRATSSASASHSGRSGREKSAPRSRCPVSGPKHRRNSGQARGPSTPFPVAAPRRPPPPSSFGGRHAPPVSRPFGLPGAVGGSRIVPRRRPSRRSAVPFGTARRLLSTPRSPRTTPRAVTRLPYAVPPAACSRSGVR